MHRISFPRFLLFVAAAIDAASFSSRAQSFEVLEPLGTSTSGVSHITVLKVSADGVAIIGHTTATGVAGVPPFIWRADTGMVVITNAKGSTGLDLAAKDVANGGNRAVFWGANTGQAERGYLWTRANGVQSIGHLLDGPNSDVRPVAISANGKVIVGRARSLNTTAIIGPATYRMWEAFRWTAETGMVGLGDIMGDPARDIFDSEAIGVSGNGRTIVGHVRYGGPVSLSPLGYHSVARWIDGVGPQVLPGPPELDDSFFARAVSANGTFVVGHYDIRDTSTINEDIYYAYRWSADAGHTIMYGPDKLTAFAPNAISDSGVAVGYKHFRTTFSNLAAIWTPDRGLLLLKDVLQEMGINTGGFTMDDAVGISADGRVIVGMGSDISGKRRGYRVALWELPPRQIIVNSVADRPALSGANCCDTGEKLPNGDAECTLRAAIEAVNAGCDDRITFAVPDVAIPKITPQTPLPALNVKVEIDGTTQSGGKVEISGTDATGICLDLQGGNSTVRGLVINNFTGENGLGIRLFGAGKNAIVGNYLGTDVSGNVPAFNGANIIVTNSSNNEIGTTKPGEGNVIGDAVGIVGKASTGNAIVANRIGIGADGTSVIGRNLGIVVGGGGGTKIGGTVGAGNRIGGFSEFAIEVFGSSDTVIEGNFIGLDVPGVRALGGAVGIVVVGINEFSDSKPTIRSNRVAGVRAGIAIVGDKVTGATVTDNVVGPRFDGSGTLPTGVDANYAKFGIRVDGAPNVQVLRNIVTGADMNLVVAGKPQMEYNPCIDTDGDGWCETPPYLRFYSPEAPFGGDEAFPPVGGVIVAANTIGLNDKLALPAGVKQRVGVAVYRGARDLQIRNNIVAGHSESDIWLRDGVRLQLMQNRIGSLDGFARNSQVGVIVDEISDVTIAPSGSFVGNTIGHQRQAAVLVRGFATNLLVRGNQIGTGPGGAVAWPNGSGITAAGPNIIALRIENNLINGSVTHGVSLELPGNKALLQGNRIGVSSAGLALSNKVGVVIKNTPVDLRDNTIAHNGAGILISGTLPALIQGGPLYQNGDGAPEAALLYLDQSHPRPVVSVFPTPSAVLPAGKAGFTFAGVSPSDSGGDVEIEIYGNRAGERQGRTPLGRRTVKANEPFAILLEGDKGSALDTLPEFSVTATQDGRTSTFSQVKPVTIEVKPVVTSTSATDITLQWPATVPFILERAHTPSGPWVPVVTVPMIVDDTAIVTLPLDGDAQYFRLILEE